MNRWRETCRVRRDLIPCPRNNNGSRNSPGTALTWPSRTWRITSTSNGCSQPMLGHAEDGAVGVDGQTADEYEVNLEANLQNLLDRAKSGTYVAPPVRRVHIPKAGSPNETRPLGIPTYEDKILQRAVLMVLEPVYETDFLDVSHGFRPGRGAHGALDVTVETGDEAGRRLDRGRRSSKVFRHDRPWPFTGVPQASGTRWCDPATDRQMAQRRGARGGGLNNPRRRHAPRRSDQPSLGQHLPALRAGRMVREGSSPPPERRSVRDPLCGRLCATKV